MSNNRQASGLSLYWLYLGIGALYVLVKLVFIAAGYLHPGAVLHGLMACVPTVLAGSLALRGARRKMDAERIWRITAAILPVLIFVITPVYMYVKQGSEWLTHGRLAVLVIYEVFAALQFVLMIHRR